jgi:hypothetical protein
MSEYEKLLSRWDGEIIRDNERYIIRLEFNRKKYKLLLFEPSRTNPNSNSAHLTIEPD